ncbi:MAG: heat-inducible transcriptional repressor HrcA [Acidimicrobiales bacterium]
MLDARKAAILTAIVEEYIDTAQPVGSSSVGAAADLNVSSATIRNEMAALEAEGYLAQPHTSAGRIPTEKGYRYFVDTAGEVQLQLPERHQISSFFAEVRGEIEHMMRDTASLLSDLTRYAAVVVDHSTDTVTARSVQLVGLTPKVVLVVVVMSNGTIDKHTIDLDTPLTDDQMARLQTVLAASIIDHPLSHPLPLQPTGQPELDSVAEAMFASLTSHGPDSDRIYVNGASRVAGEFQAIESVKKVLTILEQQLVVVNVMSGMLDRGLNVAIGTETGEDRLGECSVVVSPYEIDGERAGSIAVLGPTRMNYPQAMATVAVVSRQLGRRLSEG